MNALLRYRQGVHGCGWSRIRRRAREQGAGVLGPGLTGRAAPPCTRASSPLRRCSLCLMTRD